MNCRATRLSPEEIDRLRRDTDIVAVISRYVELKKAPNGEMVGCCPFHSERTPSFYVIPNKGIFHCFGCGKTGDVIAFLREAEKLSFLEAIERLRGGSLAPRAGFVPPDPKAAAQEDEAERKRKIALARRIWGECVSPFGTILENYIAARGLAGVVLPPTIRFHPALWQAEACAKMPAMVGAVVREGKIVGIHRTFLRPDGSGKAQVGSSKMMLGACRGGHVWIDAPGPKLAVAEGIETALTIRKACPSLPVWAALSRGNMGAAIPKGVREVILCVDMDETDRAAAERDIQKAARLLAQEGRLVRIARPDAGKDFNDMVREAV